MTEPRYTADTITDDALDELYAERDETRQQLALSQAGASAREALLTEARDLLQDAGLRGHGDCWPDIGAPVQALIEERDKWQRRYRMAYDRAEKGEAADQRVRDLAAGLRDHRISHSLTATGCADRILAALDNQEH